MKHFFERRDPWGHGLGLWVVLAMIFVAPLAIWSLKDIDLHNDIENWLPSDDPHARSLRWYNETFANEERMLVTWEGSSLRDPRVLAFAERVKGTVDEEGIRRNALRQIAKVRTPQELYAKMINEGEVEPDEALKRLNGVLVGTGNLKIQLTKTGKDRRKDVIRDFAAEAKKQLGIDLEIVDAFVEYVDRPGAESVDVSKPIVDEDGEPVEMPTVPQHDFQVRWDAMAPGSTMARKVEQVALSLRGSATEANPKGVPLVEKAFFAPGTPVAISLALSEAGSADKEGTMEAVRAIAAEVGIEPATFHMAGRPVANAALNAAVKKAAWNKAYPISKLHKRSPILLSGIVGIALAFVMLRSSRLATLVLVVSYYTVLVSVATIPLTGGSMNMVLVVMPTLLLVLTTSGAIHVCNYWKHAAHHNMKTAVIDAINMARKPCFLASMTTAIGLLSLATSPLAPVRDFGIYSAIGCVLSFLMVLYALPALLQFWPTNRPEAEEVDRSSWKQLGLAICQYRWAVMTFSVVIFGMCLYGLNYFRTEIKGIRYFPPDSRVVQDYNFLEESLAGVTPVELVIRFDKAAQDPVYGLSFFERLEIVRDIENKIRQHPEISGAISLADFRKVSPERPQVKNVLLNIRYLAPSRELERRLKDGSQKGASHYLTVAEKSADLYEPGDERLNKAGDELWRITAQVAIMSDVDYGHLTADMDKIAASVLKTHAGTRHVVTGTVPVFLRTQQAVLNSLISSFAIAFGLIAIVMMVVLRNPIAGVITMLPNILPVGVVFGLISWNGLRVDVGTMITASVALGIAVDGTLHLLTWFRDGIAHGMSRRMAVAESLAHCGPAMWQTSAAVGIGLLALYPAELLLISRFGWLMASLIGAALVADVIFLPALLAGPLGAIVERTTKKRDALETDDLVDDDSAVVEKAEVDESAETAAVTPINDHHLRIVGSNAGRKIRVD